jgi:kynureninase
MTMIANMNSIEHARNLDAQDPLSAYRDKFFIPKINGEESVYFTGNSLGLQPKSTQAYLQQELDDWAKFGVEGHFDAKNPWFSYHELLTSKIAKIVGAKNTEVVVTHSLTTNLHLLMVSFYRPTEKRYKILCEKKAFPSDQYALESQVKFHGYEPEDALIEVGPREGEHTIRHEDIISAINEHGEDLALIMMGGVNYYTGQLFDMASITKAGHDAGAVVGFDLAHAAGNVILNLHDWQVDFAAWCSYKYLNSSPGGVSGMFVHQNHESKPDLPRFAGWWGYDKESRFQMEPGFKPMLGAEGWQLSNAPILGMAAHLASLELFEEVGMEALREKSDKLTAYLEEIIEDITLRKGHMCQFEIITPKDQSQRGAQLSILAHGKGKTMFDALTKQGVIADWREPNVIRIAPVPLYNSFEDVQRFGQYLEAAISNT